MGVGLIGFLAIVAVVVIAVVGMYNSLVRLRNQVKNAWSQIDVQLKRRHDLIPNLVKTAKGYMKHERETLDSVTNARGRAVSAGTTGDRIKAETELSGALGKFFVVVENYPELKANENFLAVQEELSTTENRISFARQGYNDQVLFYNNKIEMFPSNIIAGMFHFTPEAFFKIGDETEREVPEVDFS